MDEKLRNLLFSIGNSCKNASLAVVIPVFVAILGIIKLVGKMTLTASGFWETMGITTLYSIPVILIAIVTKEILHLFVGDFFIWMSEFHFPKPKAKLDFPIHPRGKNVSLEIRDSERRLEVEYISIELSDINPLEDKFGRTSLDLERFQRDYSGIRHRKIEEKELVWKEGGGTRSGDFILPAQQSVFFYLFELGDYGAMSIPKIKLRPNDFLKGRYDFDFEISCNVAGKDTPRYISVVVENTGEEIVIESIEPR